MRANLTDISTRRWLGGVGLLIGLATLLAALAPPLGAQQPPTPHWLWGADLDSYVGAEVQAINQDGAEVGSATVDSNGGWHIIVETSQATTVTLRLVTPTVTRATDPIDIYEGGFDAAGTSIKDFHHTVSESTLEVVEATETITVRIIARRADDGRIEFGMRGPDGQDILPPARYFPDGGPGHSRWLRSSEIDFGDGFVGRIIARHVEADGRTEFGFRVEGYDDIFPQARFFPAVGPSHNRWLRSSEIEIGMPK